MPKAKKIKLQGDSLLPLLQGIVSTKEGYASVRLEDLDLQANDMLAPFKEMGMEEQAISLLTPYYEFKEFLEFMFPELEANSEVISLKMEGGVIEGVYLPCVCKLNRSGEEVPVLRCGKEYKPIECIKEDYVVNGHQLGFKFSTIQMQTGSRVEVFAVVESEGTQYHIPTILDSAVYKLDSDALEERFETYESFVASLKLLSTGGGFTKLKELPVGSYEVVGVKEKDNPQYGLIQLVVSTPDGVRNVELNSKLSKLVEEPYKMLGDAPTSQKEQIIFALVKQKGGYLHILDKEDKGGRCFVKCNLAPANHQAVMKRVKPAPDTVKQLEASQQPQTVDVEASSEAEPVQTKKNLDDIPF